MLSSTPTCSRSRRGLAASSLVLLLLLLVSYLSLLLVLVLLVSRSVVVSIRGRACAVAAFSAAANVCVAHVKTVAQQQQRRVILRLHSRMLNE